MLGLPDNVQACLFDLDGVLTQTAKVHAAAWKQMFDAFLQDRAATDGRGRSSLRRDGRLRRVRRRQAALRRASASFLASRGIELPEGKPDDPPSAETVHGLGNRKNELVLRMIRERRRRGRTPGRCATCEAAREAGLRRAVVSSSTNCRDVLAAAGIEDLLRGAHRRGGRRARAPEGQARAGHLPRGRPAARRRAGAAAVFEDALAGVEAGRAGGFGCVVGVDRVGQADALREHGADVVVRDLAELLEDR